MQGMPRLAVIDDRIQGVPVQGEILRLNQSIAIRIRQEWNMQNLGQPDSAWDWESFAALAANYPREYVAIALEAQNFVQGAMLFSLSAGSALDAAERALHVDRLATAPWNRLGMMSPPTYGGIGQCLLQYVILYSYRLGLRGRVNLSSLAAAEGFYRKHGFERINFVDSEGLPIYEIAPPAALAMLKKGRLRNG